MDAAVREQVEDAIRRNLYIGGRYRTPLGGMSFEYPVEVLLEEIVLRDGDCGLAKPTRAIAADEWTRCAMSGLWKKVGLWSFVKADDEAADAIRFCHEFPSAAGTELHRLRTNAAKGTA